MTKQWEYGSMLVSSFPVRGQLSPCVVALHENLWDCENYPMDATRMLNILGEGGWELVTALVLGNPADPDSTVIRYELKRERQVALGSPPPSDAPSDDTAS